MNGRNQNYSFNTTIKAHAGKRIDSYWKQRGFKSRASFVEKACLDYIEKEVNEQNLTKEALFQVFSEMQKVFSLISVLHAENLASQYTFLAHTPELKFVNDDETQNHIVRTKLRVDRYLNAVREYLSSDKTMDDLIYQKLKGAGL